MRLIVICVLAVSAIAVIGWFGARPFSMLVDRLHTVTLEAQSPDRFLYDRGVLRFGPNALYLLTPDYGHSTVATISPDGRVTLTHSRTDSGKSFPLGPGRADPSHTGLATFEFTPDVGDTVRYTRERSLLPWPVFEINFMTGSSPYAKRHVYCRLTWTKRSRAKLEMLWRIEQGYFGKGQWRPEKVEVMTANLLPPSITEASDLKRAAVQYLGRNKHWDRSE